MPALVADMHVVKAVLQCRQWPGMTGQMRLVVVMAGLVPAIHVFALARPQDVDATAQVGLARLPRLNGQCAMSGKPDLRRQARP